MSLPALLLEDIVRRALVEDLGTGDVTSEAVIPADLEAEALVVAREPGVLAGLPVAQEVFRQVDPTVAQQTKAQDGQTLQPGDSVLYLRGKARSLLAAERVALNFLQRMSGIATATARLVALVEGTDAHIVDTRKTVPGLRLLDKYAVRQGGGANHRFGLYDAVLIKDNHVAAAGGVAAAVRAARARAGHTVKVEVEVDTLSQLAEALAAGADLVLLDNMDPATLHEAVRLTAGRAVLEASGGITEATIRGVAETGVQLISVGALTHSVRALDLALDFVQAAPAAAQGAASPAPGRS
ncbi:MAG: carboxylating nicotinate-nucleotide diphosphorylase [Symbiobacteriia bacterium]